MLQQRACPNKTKQKHTKKNPTHIQNVTSAQLEQIYFSENILYKWFINMFVPKNGRVVLVYV